MSKALFSNNATSTLASTASIGATSLTLAAADGAKFPSPGAGEVFFVRLGTDEANEVVTVTARSSDTLTCAATDSGWSSGTPVVLTMCAEALDTLAYADDVLPLSGGTLTGDVNCGDNNVNRAELKDTSETAPTITISTGAITVNFESGNVQKVTHDANITGITLSNPPASGTAGSMTLIIAQDGTGGRTIAGWPSSVKWSGGSAPTFSTTASKVNIVTLVTIDGGTTYYGWLAGKDFA